MGRLLTTKALTPLAGPPLGASPASVLPPPPVEETAAPVAPPIEPIGAAQRKARLQSDIQNPLRKVAFYASLGVLFLRVSALSELLNYYTQTNFYLLYLFAPLAILGALTTGGLSRTFSHNAARYWLAFFGWMLLATPFSSWRADSLALTLSYARVNMPMLLIFGGLAMTWKEIRLLFYTLGISALANLVAVKTLSNLGGDGRISMEASGNFGNANDLGAHFLFVLPFLVYIVLDRARSMVLRIALAPLVGYGIWVVLGTGSRGCLVAIAAIFLCALWWASTKQRIAILAVTGILALAVPPFLPELTKNRLSAIGDNAQANNEAYESANVREYVLRQSLTYTAQHPLFGVGPGQFAYYEGGAKVAEGQRGAWRQTHNFLTQVSSEMGVPAVIFLLLAIGSVVLMVRRTYKAARKKGLQEIANTCFCFLIAFLGYLVSIVFLSQAFQFYLPTLIGLAVAVYRVAGQQLSMPGLKSSLPTRLPWQRKQMGSLPA